MNIFTIAKHIWRKFKQGLKKMRAIGKIQKMNNIIRLSAISIILLETQKDTKSNHKLMDTNFDLQNKQKITE